MADTNLVARIILRLQDEASRGLNTARQQVSGIGQEVDRVKQLAIGLFSFVTIKEGLEKLVGLSDQYTELSSKVKLATRSVLEYTQAQAEDFNIAQRTRTGLQSVSGLYAKVQMALSALGGTQTQALQITEATAQAFKLSGASAAATAGGIEQFTQALQSLVFRGDEFNSVAEAAPRLMQAIADGMGVPITALRKMAEAGELTSERVSAALLSQKDVLAAEYGALDITVGGVWQRLENKLLKYVGTSKDANEATHSIASAIEFVTEHLDGLITLASRAGEVLLVVFGASKLKALITYTEGLFAARAATAAFVGPLPEATTAVTLFSRAIGLVNKAVAGLVGWEIGTTIGGWLTQFDFFRNYLGANIAQLALEVQAFGRLITHPFSLKSWKDWTEELSRIKEHFDGVRDGIDGIDNVAPTTVFDRLKTSADSMAEGIDAALVKASGAAKTHADAMVKPYQDASAAIISGFEAQSAEIDANLQEQLYAIDYTAANEKQKLAETTQAVIAAEFEKTAAALNTKIQLDQTWHETYGKAIDLARTAGGDISALEQQGAEARIGSLQSVVNAYQSSVDSMISEEHRLLDAVRHTAEQRENLSRSVEDKIRALQQKAMGDVQAYADQQAQIDEKQAAAKKALQQGNFTEAKQYAEEAIRLAESTAHAVDKVSKDAQGKSQRKEAISENQAVAQAIAQIKESAQLADTALARLGNSQLAQAKNVAASLESAKSGLAEFKGELDKAISDANSKAQLKISIDAQSAQDELDKLAALATAKELTVKIKADPINADKEIAELQAALDKAGIKVPAVIAFDKLRDEELVKIQEELRKSIAFLTAVPVAVDTTEAVASLGEMKARIDQKLSAPTTASHTVNPDFDAVFSAINELKQNTFSTHTVYVNKVENNASGGFIQHLATGGRVAARTFRRVIGAISGPGTGTSDDVPVLASNGEFMIKTAAVNYYGTEFMNAINNLQFPLLKNYATGGAIAPVAAVGRSPDPQRDIVDLNFNFAGKTVTLQSPRSVARDLAVELRSLARVS